MGLLEPGRLPKACVSRKPASHTLTIHLR